MTLEIYLTLSIAGLAFGGLLLDHLIGKFIP
jgi:hypothetical protein